MTVAAVTAGIRSACAGISSGVGTCLLLGVEDVLLGCTESCLDFFDGGLDGCHVLSFVCILELSEGRFDLRLLVGRNLVAEILKLFFGLEDY